MYYAAWVVLILSTVILLFILFRSNRMLEQIGKLCLHAAMTICALYALNLLSGYTQLEIPFNAVTVGTVALLGIPGIGLLAALQLWVL